MNKPLILQIAVPVPFRKLFDYLPAKGSTNKNLLPGIRVKVPFGRSQKIGILVSTSDHSDFPLHKIKPVIAYLDETPHFDQQHFSWLLWVSQYYHHPIGISLSTALPALLRQDKTIKLIKKNHWQLTKDAQSLDINQLNKAPRQKALLALLQKQNTAVNNTFLEENFENWRSTVSALEKKNIVEKIDIIPPTSQTSVVGKTDKTANAEQLSAIETILKKPGEFGIYLLDGITGSGKTEVYLSSIVNVINNNKQALVLIPEIGLTPQLLQRFIARFGNKVATLHSGMTDNERYQIWLRAKNNDIQILIGTRSAIFTPMPDLGIIIIDEEHDLSFKQQEGLRYSARDIALTRAQRLNIPIILGSATPSFESLLNVKRGAFQHLILKNRAGNSTPPQIKTINIKNQKLTDNFSPQLLALMNTHLARKEQVMIFLNRRGFAPTMICQECGWIGMCQRCDHPMTIHEKKQRIICHHCGSEKKMPPQCPDCSSIDLRPRGYGTERTEQILNKIFPDIEIIRIDRDTTSRKNAIEGLLNKISDDRPQILLGTQMLAKGHDFPNVTLVGILDADQGLFGTDLRASERMAQLITQVAGRSGRGNKPGRVVIQTQHPDHPLLTVLIEHGYRKFSNDALQEREIAKLPPYTYAALLRAESSSTQNNIHFLMDTKKMLQQLNIRSIELLGPAPSPMERRAGKYRSQLLIIGENRKELHSVLNQTLAFIENCQSVKKVRWNLDVDPQDMS